MQRARFVQSALAEGLAVGALVLGGVVLVGADLDAFERAVVLTLAVVGALLHGAGNAVVGVAGLIGSVRVHRKASFKKTMSAAERAAVLIVLPKACASIRSQDAGFSGFSVGFGAKEGSWSCLRKRE